MVVIVSIVAYTVFACDMRNFFVCVHIVVAAGIIACIASFIQEKMMPGLEVFLGYGAICITAVISVVVYWRGIWHPASTMFGYGLVTFGLCMLIWTVRSSYEMKQESEEAERIIMQRDKQAAEDANEQKSRFLSHMSHEIRTPLNAVLGVNELIMRETEDENIKKYAADIQSAGRTLLALINDVLDFSKIETGKMDIVESDYSLSSILNDLVMMIQKRVTDAYYARCRHGFYMGGRVPYGYRLTDTIIDNIHTSMYTEVPKESEQLKQIYAMYAESSNSLGDIVQYFK